MNDARDKVVTRRRLTVVVVALSLLASAVIVQLVRLMVVVPMGESQQTLVLPEVQRGSILDRQGRILAVSVRQQRVSAWVPGITNAEESASLLGGILGVDPSLVADNWRRRDGYTVVQRRITAQQAEAIRKLKAEGKLAGVQVEEDWGRLYPQGRLASHVVGYVGGDNVPLDGIEYTFNDDLAPQALGTDPRTVYGNQVFLTIDIDLQFAVDRIARAAMTTTRADSLTILVMDARTGEILAYTALPDFDPNEFQKNSPQVDPRSLTNGPLSLAYEPGSVFKVFTISALLDAGTITPNTHFLTNGVYEKTVASGETFRIRDLRSYGDVTPRQIIQYSSNVGAAYASETVDNDTFERMVERFGFGKPTGLPLLGETAGLLRKSAQWSARTKPDMVFGQEIAVSAVQVITAATAIANGGMLLKPLLVRKVVSPEGAVIREYDREPLWEAISPDAAHEMLDYMETAASPEGTAHRAAVPGLRISAKTGTAQVIDPKTGAYSQSDFTASLLGIFPTDAPRLIVYVVIQNPQGQSYYGSVIAAPVFRDVAVALADKLGIPREGTQTAVVPATHAPPAAQSIDVAGKMPDFTGTPKKLLLPLLLRQDLSVTIRGNGYVYRQDPPAGTPIVKGMKIVLELQ